MKLGIGDEQIQPACGHVQPDAIAPLAPAARGPPAAASGVMWRTTVPNAVPLIRASEILHHVADPLAGEEARDRDKARLRHARRADGAGVAQDEDV